MSDAIRQLADNATPRSLFTITRVGIGTAPVTSSDHILDYLAPDLARAAADLAEAIRRVRQVLPLQPTGIQGLAVADLDAALVAYDALQQRAATANPQPPEGETA